MPKEHDKLTNQEPNQIYSITSATTGLSYDQNARKRRYLFSMSLRTICFIGAVLTTGTVRWVLIFGAIFLPYIAVVIANAGRENSFSLNKKPISPTRQIDSPNS
jgi:hypothetical protein